MTDRESAGSTLCLGEPKTTRVVEVRSFRVVVVSGTDRLRDWIVSHRAVTLGKGAGSDILLQDQAVSRNHATLTHTSQGLHLKDLSSTNGTFVKGVRVMEAVLSPGDEFRIGQTVLRVEGVTETLRGPMGAVDRLGPLAGRSRVMNELYALIQAVARSHLSVLILGETGTGKELVGRTVHELSGRSGPYQIFDCASTSPELVRSELFGHAKGAFTGATTDRKGAFREAEQGTLFLDEIGELPLELQTHLLRVLEAGTIQPVGVDRSLKVDVRVVAATHRDLKAEVERGRFREDLYYRLSVVTLRVPPLRERLEDIPGIVETLLKDFNPPVRFTPSAWQALASYDWPGNVRAMRNVIHRAAVLCADREVTPEDLGLAAPPVVRTAPYVGPESAGDVTEVTDERPAPPASRAPVEPADPAASLDDLEKEAIRRALLRHGGDREKAAEELGISLSTLKRRLRIYRGG